MGYKQCKAGHPMDQWPCHQLFVCTANALHLAWDPHQEPPILGKPRGIKQDASRCRICATTTSQHYVQVQGFYMDLSGIRHLLSHGIQT